MYNTVDNKPTKSEEKLCYSLHGQIVKKTRQMLAEDEDISISGEVQKRIENIEIFSSHMKKRLTSYQKHIKCIKS